jgi:hypothetical protein
MFIVPLFWRFYWSRIWCIFNPHLPTLELCEYVFFRILAVSPIEKRERFDDRILSLKLHNLLQMLCLPL